MSCQIQWSKAFVNTCGPAWATNSHDFDHTSSPANTSEYRHWSTTKEGKEEMEVEKGHEEIGKIWGHWASPTLKQQPINHGAWRCSQAMHGLFLSAKLSGCQFLPCQTPPSRSLPPIPSPPNPHLVTSHCIFQYILLQMCAGAGAGGGGGGGGDL